MSRKIPARNLETLRNEDGDIVILHAGEVIIVHTAHPEIPAYAMAPDAARAYAEDMTLAAMEILDFRQQNEH